MAGDFLMTCDDAEEIRALAQRHGLEARAVPMKNTHHQKKMELLIGRDLRWLREQARPEVARALALQKSRCSPQACV